MAERCNALFYIINAGTIQYTNTTCIKIKGHKDDHEDYNKFQWDNMNKSTEKVKELIEEAKRDSKELRYDILYPPFLYALASIASYGAKKYGDYNWTKSRLTGDKGPINHIYEHLGNYQEGIDYDHSSVGTDKKYHLAAIALNAMMEFWYESNELDTSK